jgi:hypothetical protein
LAFEAVYLFNPKLSGFFVAKLLDLAAYLSAQILTLVVPWARLLTYKSFLIRIEEDFCFKPILIRGIQSC